MERDRKMSVSLDHFEIKNVKEELKKNISAPKAVLPPREVHQHSGINLYSKPSPQARRKLVSNEKRASTPTNIIDSVSQNSSAKSQSGATDSSFKNENKVNNNKDKDLDTPSEENKNSLLNNISPIPSPEVKQNNNEKSEDVVINSEIATEQIKQEVENASDNIVQIKRDLTNSGEKQTTPKKMKISLDKNKDKNTKNKTPNSEERKSPSSSRKALLKKPHSEKKDKKSNMIETIRVGLSSSPPSPPIDEPSNIIAEENICDASTIRNSLETVNAYDSKLLTKSNEGEIEEIQLVEEVIESKEFIDLQKELAATLTIYLPKQQITKTVKVSMDCTVEKVIASVVKSTRISDDVNSLVLYYPKTSIILHHNRKIWSYLFSDKEKLELSPKTNPAFKGVSVVIQYSPQAEEFIETVDYGTQTTVRGVLQTLIHKSCQRSRNYGLHNEEGLLLDEDRTLSSYRLDTIYYKEKTTKAIKAQSKGFVILKILLVDASGAKIMKCERSCTIREVISRVAISTTIPNESIGAYGLFEPLGPPFPPDTSLEHFNDQEIIEFKRMPPHLLQIFTKQKEESKKKRMGPMTWDSEEVSRWIVLKGFTQLKETFETHQVNGERLLNLTNDKLKDELNISALGLRKLLLKEIGLLKQSSVCGDLSISLRKPTFILEKTKLDSAPLLANPSSYVVIDRNVFKLHSDVVVLLVKELEAQKAWEVEGIFRISGKRESIMKIHTSLKNTTPNFNPFDVHDVACALKQYLREISDPMIPMDLYNEFMLTVHEGTVDVVKLREAIKKLPESNYFAMDILLNFCFKITEYEHMNKMNSRNLGIVFGPTVMRAPDPMTDFQNAATHTILFKLLIENLPSLFVNDEPVL